MPSLTRECPTHWFGWTVDFVAMNFPDPRPLRLSAPERSNCGNGRLVRLMADVANGLGVEAAPGGMALLIVDTISCWSFPDAKKLLPGALAIAPRIAALKARCARAAVPPIYANDNMGRWRSDFARLVAMSLDCGGNAAAVTTALRPSENDYFILKPKHSAFYATPLTLLLQDLKVDRLIVCSVAQRPMRHGERRRSPHAGYRCGHSSRLRGFSDAPAQRRRAAAVCRGLLAQNPAWRVVGSSNVSTQAVWPESFSNGLAAGVSDRPPPRA